MHHTAQIDGADFQALLAGAATRTARVAYHRANKRISASVRGILAVRDDRLFFQRALAFSRRALVGCGRGCRRIVRGTVFAGALFARTGMPGFGCALRLTAISGTRFGPPMFFPPAGLAPACVEKDFTGATTATPLDFAGACAGAGLPLLNGDAPVLTALLCAPAADSRRLSPRLSIGRSRLLLLHRLHRAARFLDDLRARRPGQSRDHQASQDTIVRFIAPS